MNEIERHPELQICPNLCNEGKICRQLEKGRLRNEFTIYPLEIRQSFVLKMANKINGITKKEAVIPRNGVKSRIVRTTIEDCLNEKKIDSCKVGFTVWEPIISMPTIFPAYSEVEELQTTLEAIEKRESKGKKIFKRFMKYLSDRADRCGYDQFCSNDE